MEDSLVGGNKEDKEFSLMDVVAARIRSHIHTNVDCVSENGNDCHKEEKGEISEDSAEEDDTRFLLELVYKRQHQHQQHADTEIIAEEEPTTPIIRSTQENLVISKLVPLPTEALKDVGLPNRMKMEGRGVEEQAIPRPVVLRREQGLPVSLSYPGAFAVSITGTGTGVMDTVTGTEMQTQDVNATELAVNSTLHESDCDSSDFSSSSQPEEGARNDGLAVASLVVGETNPRDLPQAQNYNEETRREERKQFKSKVLLSVIVLLALIIILLVPILFILVPGKQQSNDALIVPTIAPTEPPSSTAPSQAPSTFTNYVLSLFPLEAVDAISEYPQSPQSRAFEWLLEDSHNLPSYEDSRIKQKLALATLYFATNGDHWYTNTNWLNHSTHECEWFLQPEFARKSTKSQFYDSYLTGDFLEPPPDSPCNSNGMYQHLWLDLNNLVGSLPEELYLLTSLQTLSVGVNDLRGTISTRIGQLTNLEGLVLGRLQLRGTIPSEIGLMKHLYAISLVGNDRLEGFIPSEIWTLTTLDTINLRNNPLLKGTIATEVGLMSALRWLILDDCSIYGSIPTELGKADALDVLYLASNQLSSTIPSELGNLPNLASIQLFGNSLQGTLPTELGMVTSTTMLTLGHNQLSGPLPSELGLLTKMSIALELQGNQFLSGTIPTELGRLTNVLELDLSHTQVSGQIPSELAQLTSLGHLSFANDAISGTVPQELADLEPSLYALKLEGNPLLSGTIAPSLCQINATCIGSAWKTSCEEAQDGLSFDCTGILCGCDCPCF
ncbi:Leucine Rich Repeat [Seminavis robusta]|uniref:Leucine Rich Repeat n=1 Tax=Seminavis robusta TaxID=568900 RepID=A0A9N8H358_9STRA|nr:Leucine Rich Repeat [Seminavis robusta]|eukprot:Sro52_g030940.1 Leucine Rich Repeat (782) ;mRNA; f:49995-52422